MIDENFLQRKYDWEMNASEMHFLVICATFHFEVNFPRSLQVQMHVGNY